MPMTSKERVLQREHDRGVPVGKMQGKADALDLAARSPSMDGTAIIAEEQKVPLFEWGKDYSKCQRGAPIGEIIDGEFFVFTMITPVNTANYPGMQPSKNPAEFSMCHTKDPAKARHWVASNGTSGLWRLDEACTYPATDGTNHVWRNKHDNNAYPPLTLTVEHYWEDLGEVSLWQ